MEVASPLRVVLVDDHAMFRTSLRMLLGVRPEVEVVGEADNGAAGLEEAERTDPDVILMDYEMPVLDGIEAARRARHPVVILTGTQNDEKVVDALLAGASAYVLKDAPIDQIVAALQAAARGEAFFSPRVAGLLADRVRRHPRPAIADRPAAELDERELRLLRHVAAGADDARIATELELSAHTVQHHVSRLLEKLDVDNRVQAAVWAARHGVA